MAIMFEPKGDREVNSTSNTSNDLPLGQKPEGDQFDNALFKLENTFNLLISRVNALEENLNKLQKTKDKEEPLVLTKDMEVTNGSK